MGEDTTQIRRSIEDTRARMDETVEALGYKADVPSRVRDNISDRIETVKDTVSDVMSSGKNALLGGTQNVSDALDATGDRAASARQAVSMAAENPLGLALGAFALGFLGGLLLPMSDLEREKIGPVREQIANRAQTAVAEAVEAGKSVLDDTIAAATEAGKSAWDDTTAAAAESAQQKGKEIVQHATAGTPAESQSASS
jgi:hypothetical protein